MQAILHDLKLNLCSSNKYCDTVTQSDSVMHHALAFLATWDNIILCLNVLYSNDLLMENLKNSIYLSCLQNMYFSYVLGDMHIVANSCSK